MRNEQEFNSCIGRSLDWHFKIPDDSRCQKPFDGFGVIGGRPIYWESKFLREPKAFNWNRLEDHQLYHLKEVKKHCPNCMSVLIIGVVFGRGDIRVFVFDDLEEIEYRKKNGLSILKKEWLTMEDYLSVRYGRVDLSEKFFSQ